MQEVRDLTAVLSDAISFVRQAHATAKETLTAEVAKARVNVDKVTSLTQEFKRANLELEAFIGGTASNFPPADSELPGQEKLTGNNSHLTKPDINGVSLNKGTS